MITAIVAVVFLGWFALSVANQFDLLSEKIGRFDYLKLIPRWTFFAPNPGTNDYHLVYRDQQSDGTFSSWQELAELNSGHNVSCLWNPQRRVTKTIADTVNNILRVNAKIPDFSRSVKFTLEYMILLQAAHKPSPTGKQRQFAVVQTHGFGQSRQLQLVLLSELHGVGTL